jgi:catechol 2,3-dioxygenase-like lactoylglutathione lyase family enzyme
MRTTLRVSRGPGVAAALAALLLAVGATRAAAQYPQRQPWNGGGVTVSEAAQQAVTGRKGVAGAVALVSLTVSDADRSRRFFEDVLTFRTIRDTVVDGAAWNALTATPASRVRMVRLALGEEQLELVQYLDRRGRPAPADMQSNDRWFQHVAIIVRDIESAYATLERAGVTRVSPRPQTLPASIPAAAGISAFYFRDPDGHPLEILSFPPDKGAAKWHEPGRDLFQGIDHTAIVVWDTDASLRFYQRLLGLDVKGESLNQGPEQERLNNVVGARLRITGLRAPKGPGVEFLDYRSPRSGRPYPGDARPNDLLHWHTRIAVNDVKLALERARADGHRLISRDVVPMDPALTGYRRAVMLRDPDGHAVELVER